MNPMAVDDILAAENHIVLRDRADMLDQREIQFHRRIAFQEHPVDFLGQPVNDVRRLYIFLATIHWSAVFSSNILVSRISRLLRDTSDSNSATLRLRIFGANPNL